MRLIASCLILVCTTVRALAADSPTPANLEQAVRDRTKAFDAAWNRHDAEAVAAFYATDGDLVTETGDVFTGRDGIQKILTDAFDGDLKNSTLSSTVSSVRLIKPDVAIVDSDAELKPGEGDPRKVHVISVLVNQNGKWLTATTRAIHYGQQ